jgi:hypothetical protein
LEKEERALFKSGISAATERRREIEAHPKKTRSWRGRGKSERTALHVRHIPDLPGREITIEVTSTQKHCTTAATEQSKDKNGLEKNKRRAHFSKIELVLPQKEEGK